MALKSSLLGKSAQKSLGRLFSSLPLTPNQITALSLLFSAIGLYSASQLLPLHSLLFFFLAGAADALDGAVARAKRMVSDRGAYIDGIIDRLVEFLLVLSFFFYSLPSFILPSGLSLVILLFFGSCMTSFATAYAEHRHVADSRRIARQPGLLPRAERLMLLFLALLLVPFAPPLSSAAILAAAALSMVTFAQRFLYYSE